MYTHVAMLLLLLDEHLPNKLHIGTTTFELVFPLCLYIVICVVGCFMAVCYILYVQDLISYFSSFAGYNTF